MVEPRSRVTAQMILGLCVILVGALWTLDNFDLIESEPILRWWPLLLVAVGVAKLTGVGTPRHVAAGAVIGLIGSWLLADSLDLADADLWDLWPLALIAFGYGMLRRGLTPDAGRVPGGAAAGTGTDPSALIQSFALMSGVDRRITSQEFRGGEVTALMGGVELNLREARPVPGGAVLNLFAMWGGIDVTVPDHWRVINEATVLLGGIEDRTRTAPAEAQETLILRGLVVMGGVEIKN